MRGLGLNLRGRAAKLGQWLKDPPWRPLPFLFQLDVEPDLRQTDHGANRPWVGFEALIGLIEDWRAEMERLTRRPAIFDWAVRADPQVAEDHGDAGWAFRHYRRHWDRVRARGDHLTLHVHLWRWERPQSSWLADYVDQNWIEHSLDLGFDAFRREVGEAPLTFRMGDTFMNQKTFDSLIRRGIRYERSLEPGREAARSIKPDDPTIGMLPETLDLTGDPYQPAAGDYRRARSPGAEGPPIWVIPTTTGRILHQSMLAPDDPRLRILHQANLEYEPAQFRTILASGLAKLRRPFAAPLLRSSGALEPARRDLIENLRFLRDFAKEKPLRFMTAEGLIESLGLRRSPGP